MYYIWPLLNDIISVTLRFSHGFSKKCIGYNTNCIGTVTQSKPTGTTGHRCWLLFSLRIKDIATDNESEIRFFADGCGCYREIRVEEDTLKLKKDTDRLGCWARRIGYDISTCQMQYDAADNSLKRSMLGAGALRLFLDRHVRPTPLKNHQIWVVPKLKNHTQWQLVKHTLSVTGERGGSVVECWTPEREVQGSRPTSAVLCPWARHFTPRKYWLITQEAMAPSRHDWKIVDWDVKPQHNQPTFQSPFYLRFLWENKTNPFFHIFADLDTLIMLIDWSE